MSRIRKLLFALIALSSVLSALAQSPDLLSRVAALGAATKSAQPAGDNAWMLTSAAVVLMMTGPGLALSYGGLVPRKNVAANSLATSAVPTHFGADLW